MEKPIITLHRLNQNQDLLTEENTKLLINFDYQLQRQHQKYYRLETRDMTSWLYLATIDELIPKNGNTDVYGIFSDDKMIGYLSLMFYDRERYGSVSALYLHSDHRGYGLGMDAIAYAEKIFRDKKYTSFILNVSALNRKAISLYKRSGFKVISADTIFSKNEFRRDTDSACSIACISPGKFPTVVDKVRELIMTRKYHPRLFANVNNFLVSLRRSTQGHIVLELHHRRKVIGYLFGYKNGTSIMFDTFVIDRDRVTSEVRSYLNLILKETLSKDVKFVYINANIIENSLMNQMSNGKESSYILEKTLK